MELFYCEKLRAKLTDRACSINQQRARTMPKAVLSGDLMQHCLRCREARERGVKPAKEDRVLNHRMGGWFIDWGRVQESKRRKGLIGGV